MKHLTLTLVFFAFSLLASGQTGDLDIKSTDKNLVKINESLYASKFEVTNKQYLTFLSFLKHNNQADTYLVCQIDTAKWSDKLSFNEPFVKYYHAHPAYADYPVVNISYEGATLFCEWLSDQYNANDKSKFKKVRFRLPTEEEWITAAKGGNPTAVYPWEGSDLQTHKGLYRCNHMRAGGDDMGVAGKLNDNADVTAPVQSYFPNSFGLYNMSGNVAEMLAEKGHTKGGSWQDTAENMKIESNGKFANFNSPMSTIGFRYFMDVIEK